MAARPLSDGILPKAETSEEDRPKEERKERVGYPDAQRERAVRKNLSHR